MNLSGEARKQNKIYHSHQLGGIETSVLDKGPGRGTRIAQNQYRTGLSYKVVPDVYTNLILQPKGSIQVNSFKILVLH